jgi:GGDEF domain-containing protein
MSDPASKEPQAHSAPKLSIAQMLGVMRVEFHRARTQRYPMCALMIAVDALKRIQEKQGWKGKDEAIRLGYDALKNVSRKGGFFGMALMSGDRIMAIFPNTSAARMGELGAALNAAARQITIDCGGDRLPLALSLGAAHNLLAETNSSFEGLVQAAGRALYLATEGTGDRYVMWREAEAEIDHLRGELEAQRKSFQAEQDLMREELSEIGGLQQAAIIDKIQKIFAGVARTAEIEALEKRMIEMAVAELFEERRKAVTAQMAEHRQQMDMLERRIAKLTSLLGVTESELRRVLAMKNIDAGVASLYQTVQGLTDTDPQAESKKALMGEIFQQNLTFQKRNQPAVSGAST